MKNYLLASSLLLFPLLSCAAPSHLEEPNGVSEMWAGEWINTASVDKAIVAERTIYPYHFVTTASALTELGADTLEVLARHYREYPGSLNVRRGDASDELYDRRVVAVLAALASAGVEPDAVAVTDRLAHGSGMSSKRVRDGLKREHSAKEKTFGRLTSGTQTN